MRFRDFINETTAEKFEDLLHHIAEEELIACKVHHIRELADNQVEVYADCQDVPRQAGFQPDLTQKLQQRLRLHPLQKFHLLKVKVIHSNVDEYEKLGEGWKHWAAGAAVAGAVTAATVQADKLDKAGTRVIDGVPYTHAPYAATNWGMLPKNVEKTTIDGKPAYKWTERAGGKMGSRTYHLWTYVPDNK